MQSNPYYSRSMGGPRPPQPPQGQHQMLQLHAPASSASDELSAIREHIAHQAYVQSLEGQRVFSLEDSVQELSSKLADERAATGTLHSEIAALKIEIQRRDAEIQTLDARAGLLDERLRARTIELDTATAARDALIAKFQDERAKYAVAFNELTDYVRAVAATTPLAPPAPAPLLGAQ